MPGAKDLSRRRFIGAAAGAAGLAAVGSSLPATFAAAAPGGSAVGERLVPPGKLGIQQFSIRDAITRRSIANSLANGLTPTRGYLGGPDFPNNPADLGPLVDLPGGFAETFEFLASIGYRGFEFFQFNQNINELGRQPTSAEIRTYLDNAGLASFGTHTGAINTMFDATTGALSAAGQTQVLIAQTLGHTMIGTAGDPTALATLADRLNANGTITPGWTEMARRANALVELLAPLGLRWYWHTEQNGWQFFTDPDLTRTHRIDWWAANTSSAVRFEPDLQHSFAGRARFPDPVDGSRWDALGFWKTHSQRLVGWHIKDGNRLVPPPPLVTTNPFTQVVNRPPTFVAGAGGTPAGADCIYAGEGSIGQGYPVDPDPAVVGYKRIFDEVPAKGSRFFIVESDNAIGNAADPGRSLRHAKYSMLNMLGLRGGYTGQGHSSVPDEAIFESAFEDGVAVAG